MINDSNWTIDDISDNFFKDNYKYFNNMGGDIETIFFMTKIEHGKRVLFKPEDKKKINLQDLQNAFKVFKINKQLKKDKKMVDAEDEGWKNLYN